MGERQPPRFVPTLTDVVTLPSAPVVEDFNVNECASQGVTTASIAGSFSSEALPLASDELKVSTEIAELIQARVMARLDESLENDLHAALAAAVQMHSQNFYAHLRQDVERLVMDAVHATIVQEMAQISGADDV